MEKRDRQSRGPAQVTGSRDAQRALRPAPGKVTRTSKLSQSREPAVQRKAAVTGDEAAPSGSEARPSRARSRWELTMDPWMDAAHRGATALLSEPGYGPVQARGSVQADDPASVQHAAAAGVTGAGNTLPYLDRIQEAFGGAHDLSQVRAHVGGDAAAASEHMGAEAYATGDHVAFRGQPDLYTAAHEAAHVIQQRGGVQLTGGLGQVGDRYEQHADAVAELVVRGQSAESLLDAYAGDPRPPSTPGERSVAPGLTQRAGGHAIQRYVYESEEDKDEKRRISGTREEQLRDFIEEHARDKLDRAEVYFGRNQHITVAELFKVLEIGVAAPAPASSEHEPSEDEFFEHESSEDESSEDESSEDGSSEDGSSEYQSARYKAKSTKSAEYESGEKLKGVASERPIVFVHMGQGASGSLEKYQFSSSDFFSCVPITMHRSEEGHEKEGGVFHLPAGCLKEQEQNLKEMVDQIRPTEIRIYKGWSDPDSLYHHTAKTVEGQAEEGAGIAQFFRDYCAANNLTCTVQHPNKFTTCITLTLDSSGNVKWLTRNLRLHSQSMYDLGRMEKPLPDGVRRYQNADWQIAKAVELRKL